MSWFKSLILITISLTVYINASSYLKNDVSAQTTSEFLGKSDEVTKEVKGITILGNKLFKKPDPESDEGIMLKMDEEGVVGENKEIFKNPIVVPKRSQIILERAKRKKSTFKTMLRREYLKLAERLTKHKNWTDATYFRRKAYKARKSDKDILPEDPNNWEIEDDYLLSELYDARVKLLDGLTADTVFLVPNAAAKSIVYYDCWLEQTQNTWVNDPTDCKQSFFDVHKYLKQAREEVRIKSVISILENYPLVDVEEKFFPYKNMVDNDPYEGDYASEMKETVTKAIEAEEEMNKAELEKANKANVADSGSSNAGFIVDESANNNPEIVFATYFAEKSFALNDAAKSEIDKAYAEIQKVKPGLIIINGHTDRAVSGSEALILSKRRADAVRDYLVTKGLPSTQIRSFGFGNSDNLVENPEGVAVQGNRRAEIIFRSPN